MRLRPIILVILAAALTPTAAFAIDTHSSTPFRQVIAEAVVPDRNNQQLYFSVVASTFSTNEIHRWAPADEIYYQFSDTVDVEADGKVRTLRPGDGIFLAAGTQYTVRSSGSPPSPSYLQFRLSPTPETAIADATDGTSVELYRSPTPIPGLMHERNVLSLTRVPVPPEAPPDPLHRRTGAALHYILSGVGAEFADGRAVARGPGSVSYEPAGYSYQWSNPGLRPLTYLLLNISPKGFEPTIGTQQPPKPPFALDRHLTVAICCVAISMVLTLIVSSGAIADYHRERRSKLDNDDDRL
jgi:mannose-6-phosphate isomerase-like protein (cupin superfamily)